jgi:hypothetical protein
LEEREPSTPSILEFIYLSSSQHEKLDEIWKKSVASLDARQCHSPTTEAGKDLLSKTPLLQLGMKQLMRLLPMMRTLLGKVVFPQRLHVVNLSNDSTIVSRLQWNPLVVQERWLYHQINEEEGIISSDLVHPLNPKGDISQKVLV